MKKFSYVMLLAAVACFAVSSVAMADKKQTDKKKSEKPKKEYVWKSVKPSGNASVDKYLTACEDMYNKMKTYADGITWYEVTQFTMTDAEGNVLKAADGSDSLRICITDQNGNVRGTGEAIWQYTQTILAGGQILDDAASVAILNAAAATALPSLGLGALTYTKPVTVEGPKLILNVLPGSIKEIIARMKTQRTAIRTFKANTTAKGELKDATMSAENITAMFGDEVKNGGQMASSALDEALAQVNATDGQYQDPGDEDGDANAI